VAPRRCQGEEGASLLLALAFLVLFSLFIPQLLNLASADLLATSRLHEQRAEVYAAGAATEGTIQYLRQHGNCGRFGFTCPITNFSTNVNNLTATTTFTFAGTPIDFDRTFNLTTTVGGRTRVQATVIIRDSNPTNSSEVPVDVTKWTYVR
jgi:hypothetical protein